MPVRVFKFLSVFIKVIVNLVKKMSARVFKFLSVFIKVIVNLFKNVCKSF